MRAAAQRISFRAPDGVELTLHKISPEHCGSRRPVVLVPGMFCDHAFFLQRGRGLAHFLAKDQPVYVLQRRVQGFYEDIVEQDVPAAVAEVVRDSKSDKLVLGGVLDCCFFLPLTSLRT